MSRLPGRRKGKGQDGSRVGRAIILFSVPALDPLSFFTPEDIARGLFRARINLATGAFEILLDLLLLYALAFGAAGRRLDATLARVPETPGPLSKLLGLDWRKTAAFVAAVALLRQALGLPFALVREHAARTLGLSHESALSWVRRFFVDTTLSCLGLMLAAVAIVAVRRRVGRRWWVAVGAIGAVLLVADATLEPYRTRLDFAETALPAGALNERLTALAHAHHHAATFTVIDASRYGSRVNAFTTGFGPGRRIVLTDTLLKLGDEAVVGAVAHEIGHRREERMPVRLAMACVGLFVFLCLLEHVLEWARRAGARTNGHAFSALLAALTVLNLAVMPLRAALGRQEEREADLLELSVRDDLDAYVASQVALVRANVLVPNPRLISRLLSSHPTPMERIERAVELGRVRARHPSDGR